MKTKKIELDVDFIGGDKPLTAKEEKERVLSTLKIKSNPTLHAHASF
jgi:hypothetical protein